jgi:hypothetical protein
MNQSVFAQLLALFCNQQFATVPVRAVLAQVTPENVNEFHDEFNASEHGELIATELARLGIVPPLPEGVPSPLELTPDGADYANPEAANRFLSVQFGHAALKADADSVEAFANDPAAVESTIQPVPESVPQVEVIDNTAIETPAEETTA